MILEKGKYLLQCTNHQIAFDFIFHIGEREIFWIRLGKVARQFIVTILNRDLINYRF